MADQKYTIQEIGARTRARKPESFANFTDEQIGQRLVDRNPQLQSIVAAPAHEGGVKGGFGGAIGVAQSYVAAPQKFAESGMKLGEEFGKTKVGQFLGGGIRAIASKMGLSPEQQAAIGTAGRQVISRGTEQPEFTKAKNADQRTGQTIGNVSQYLLPSGMTTKAAGLIEKAPGIIRLGKFAAPVARGVAEGVAGTAIGAGQTGSATQAAGIGAADLAITTGLGIAAPVVGRVARAVSSKLPDIKPTLSRFTGGGRKVAGVVDAMGIEVPKAPPTKFQATGAAITEKIKGIPGEMFNRIIKPTKNAYAYGRNPGKALADLGITANTDEELLSAITGSKSSIGELIGNSVKNTPKNKRFDLRPIYSSIDESIAKAVDNGEQALVRRLQDIKSGLTEIFRREGSNVVAVGSKVPTADIEELWQIKRKIGSAAKFTGQAFDNEANQARVRIYNAIGDIMEKNVTNPQFKRLNELYGNLVEAESAMQSRLAVSQRNLPLGLGDISLGGVGAIAGGPIPAIGLALGSKMGRSTAFRTRAAKILNDLINRDLGRTIDPIRVAMQFEDVYKKAPAAKTFVDKFADDALKKLGGIKVIKAPVKGYARAMEKVINDYNGDVSKIGDLARNTIIVNSEADVQRIIQSLQTHPSVIKGSVTLPSPETMGYFGGNIKVMTDSGLMAEIQVNTPAMLYAKEKDAQQLLGNVLFNKIKKATGMEPGRGHALYEKFRVMSPEEMAGPSGQSLAKQSADYYQKIRTIMANSSAKPTLKLKPRK